MVNGAVAIVCGVNERAPKNKFEYKTKTTHRGYICSINDIMAILGQGDIEAWERCITAPAETVKAVRPALWGPLAGVKPGTQIQIRGRHGPEIVIYTEWAPTRPKYPLGYQRGGKQWKGPGSSVLGVVQDDGSITPIVHTQVTA